MNNAHMRWRPFVGECGAAIFRHVLCNVNRHGAINQMILTANDQANMFQPFGFQITVIMMVDEKLICQRSVRQNKVKEPYGYQMIDVAIVQQHHVRLWRYTVVRIISGQET